MLDPTEKVSDHHSSSSELEDQSKIQSPSGGESKKTCADCGTSKTPLWRGGPAGPKSLCNACGIRSRKKRRAVLGMNKSEDKKSKRGENLKERFLAMGREVLVQKRSKAEKQRRKLGEEEQAAVLLMALSYGSVYA